MKTISSIIVMVFAMFSINAGSQEVGLYFDQTTNAGIYTNGSPNGSVSGQFSVGSFFTPQFSGVITTPTGQSSLSANMNASGFVFVPQGMKDGYAGAYTQIMQNGSASNSVWGANSNSSSQINAGAYAGNGGSASVGVFGNVNASSNNFPAFMPIPIK